jgi:hypothetical protein
MRCIKIIVTKPEDEIPSDLDTDRRLMLSLECMGGASLTNAL